MKHFRDGLCVVACERRYVIDMSERHNEKIRSIFEMGFALLHADVLISILQKKQPAWAAFSVKGRVYYYDKPNIGNYLFFFFQYFSSNRGRGACSLSGKGTAGGSKRGRPFDFFCSIL